MNQIFIKNPTDQEVGVRLFKEQNASGDVFENVGPEPAVRNSNDATSIVCAPFKTFSTLEASESETGYEVFVGNFVVEINRVIVPYIFPAHRLAEYFSLDNAHNTDIAFIRRDQGEALTLRLLNLNIAAEKEVRIYVVSENGFVDNEFGNYTKLDPVSGSVIIKLKSNYNVSCDGSHPFAGLVELDLTGGVTVRDDQGKVHIYENLPSFINGMRMNWGVNATQLTEWTGPTLTLEPINELVDGASEQTVYHYEGEEDVTKTAWKTTDSSIATVDENGLVTGVGNGTCNLLLTVNDYLKATTLVTSTINAVATEFHYDGFYQVMNVTGKPGTLVETKTLDGFNLGDGEIGLDGTLTYPIIEGNLEGGLTMRTSVVDGTEFADHRLVTSLHVSMSSGTLHPYFFVQRDLENGWLSGISERTFSSDATGEIIVEYGQDQFVVNVADFAEDGEFMINKTGAKSTNYSYDTKPLNEGSSVRVRFRNLSDQIFFIIGQGENVYKFFDDGISNVGYQLAGRMSGQPDITLKTIPKYLPPCITNMNAMFWGEDDTKPVFDSASVEENLSLWDVSNVKSMVTTFGYGVFFNPPIKDWAPVNVVYAIDTFSVSNINTDLNWNMPKCISVEYMFGDNVHFNGNLNLTFEVLENMNSFLLGCESFNKPLEQLNTSTVKDLFNCLSGCSSFDQPMNDFDVSAATNLYGFFQNCTNFNKPLSKWYFPNLIDERFTSGLHHFLNRATSYSQDLTNWCVPMYSEMPRNFADQTQMTLEQMPKWGTCPVQVATVTISDFPALTSGDNFRPDFTSDPDFTANTVVWTSSNEEVVTVDGQGTLTIVGHGTTTIGLIVNGRFTDQKDLVITAPQPSNTTVFGFDFIDLNMGGFIMNDGDEEFTIEWPNGATQVVEPNNGYAPPSNLVGTGPQVAKIVHSGRASLQLNHNSVTSVIEWSDLGYSTLRLGSRNLVSVPDHAPPLLVNYSFLFKGTDVFNDPNVSLWRPVGLLYMFEMCAETNSFNQSLNDWDVSRVNSFASIFSNAKKYNQPLNKWDTANSTNFSFMFSGALEFNQSINSFNMAKATNCEAMFQTARAYNQPMDNLNVSKVTNFKDFLWNANAFGQDLSGWCVPLISSSPTRFQGNTKLVANQLPVWGTCPAG